MLGLTGEEYGKKTLDFAADQGTASTRGKLAETVAELDAAGPAVRRSFFGLYQQLAEALGLEPDRTAAWPVLEKWLGPELKGEARGKLVGLIR